MLAALGLTWTQAHAATKTARVDAAGALVGGHNALSSAKIGLGATDVRFDAPITGCGLQATVAESRASFVFQPAGAAVFETPFPDTVRVFTRDATSAVDVPFHLAVTCSLKERWARVASDGALIGGSAVGSGLIGTGDYVTKFARRVAPCGYVATTNDDGPRAVWVARTPGSPFAVSVHLGTYGGTPTNVRFYLGVTCGTGRSWAVVTAAGAAVRGGSIAGTTHVGPGQYEVRISRPITSRCAFLASRGDPGSGMAPMPGFISLGVNPFTADAVFVETKNAGGGPTDSPFHLLVDC